MIAPAASAAARASALPRRAATSVLKQPARAFCVPSKERLVIFDTTLRDGEQTPGATLNITEKLQIARQLSALGVDVCEAGFPIASPGDFEAVKAIAENIGPMMEGREASVSLLPLAEGTLLANAIVKPLMAL